MLSVKGSESTFRIVETNDFKQLPHITLSFRPGNDFAVKQFLAFRLAEVKSNNQELSCELAKSKARDARHAQQCLCPCGSWPLRGTPAKP